MLRLRLILSLLFFLVFGIAIGYLFSNTLSSWFSRGDTPLLSPLSDLTEPDLPLLKYSITEVSKYPFQASPIQVIKELPSTSTFKSYLVSFQTMNKTMTGVLNVPVGIDTTAQPAVILLIRGYVPLASYTSGTGTKNAANYFADNGFITISPDFFGYGASDPEFSDEWEARFAKPIQIVELLQSIKTHGVPLDGTAFQQVPTDSIGIWAHSNGGQIALTALEILKTPIPTTLWAPVTAPFPYSVLFYSDEEADEGKAARAWIQLFEEKYDSFDFSLTKHLENLTGPLQLHHGVNDEAAPVAWSDEFVEKIEQENERRGEVTEAALENSATTSATATAATAAVLIEVLPIELEYFRYPTADHNLQPSWSTAIQRDLTFFRKELR